MKHTTLVALIALLALSANMALAAHYTIARLDDGSLYGSGAYDINDQRQVAGYRRIASIYDNQIYDHACYWTDGRCYPPPILLSNGNTRGLAMKNNVTDGYSFTMVGTEVDHAIYWDDAGDAVLGGDAGGYYAGAAEDVSASLVVGYVRLTSPPYPGEDKYAYAWQDSMRGVVLGRGSAHSANDAGVIAGDADGRAAWWTISGGVVTQHALSDQVSTARSINSAGQMAGWCWNTALERTEACIWNGSTTTWLGTLPGFSSSRAYGMNDSMQVVGVASVDGGVDHAVLWDDGAMRDLGALVPGGRSQAYAINSEGWIVGSAVDADGLERAVLWTEVPEPSSLLALTFGLSAIAGAIRSRSRARSYSAV